MSQDELGIYRDRLYSKSAREIKEALDYFAIHPDQAIEFKPRISELRQYGETVSGMGAAQVEVAAIILWNQLTFKK